MKNVLFIAVATTLTLSSAGVQAEKSDIVVSSGRSIEKFVDDVSRELDRYLSRATLMVGPVYDSGLAQVLFKAGPDGRADQIRMYNKDRNDTVNRIAKFAVSRIHSLDPPPAGAREDQVYLANIIIARDDADFRRLSQELNRREAHRLAATNGDGRILAFTINRSRSPRS